VAQPWNDDIAWYAGSHIGFRGGKSCFPYVILLPISFRFPRNGVRGYRSFPFSSPLSIFRSIPRHVVRGYRSLITSQIIQAWCSPELPFPGTVFRLPFPSTTLRAAAQEPSLANVQFCSILVSITFSIPRYRSSRKLK